MRHLAITALVVGVAAPAGLAAQDRPAPQAQAAAATIPAQPAPSPAPAQGPTPPGNYVYVPDGRRDPFVSLLKRGDDSTRAAVGKPRAEGVAGLTTEELVVRGIVQSRGAWVAMVTGAAGKVYTVRTGDKISDGTVQSIAAQYLVIQQQVNDPLSVEKQREVRKFLRSGENK